MQNIGTFRLPTVLRIRYENTRNRNTAQVAEVNRKLPQRGTPIRVARGHLMEAVNPKMRWQR